MHFGGIGPREAIFGICGLAAAYIAVALFQLVKLQRRRRRRERAPVTPVAVSAAMQPVPPVAPPAATIEPPPRVDAAPADALLADSRVVEESASRVEPPEERARFPVEIKHSVVRIYVRSASVEVPNMSRLPRYAVQPSIDVGLVVNAHPVWAEHLECSLGISLHAKLNGMTMFLMEIVQCGLFLMHETDPRRLNEFVRETAQSVLFPYARKYLAALAVDAGFQPLILDPIDFGDLLAKATQRFQIAPTARASA